MDLLLTSNTFTAIKNQPNENFSGIVEKSEFDWDILQTSKDPITYEIKRLGYKFNSILTLNIENGIISGEYQRPGPNIDWDVNGFYKQNGNISLEIDAPLTLGVSLKGTISSE
jgi:hypothetical protein